MILRPATDISGKMLVLRILPRPRTCAAKPSGAVCRQVSGNCSFHSQGRPLVPHQTRPAPPVLSRLGSRATAPSANPFLCPRLASTITTPAATNAPAAATAPASGAAAADASDESRLTWNRFLQLRAVRRRFNLGASAVSAGGALAAGVTALTAADLDALSANLPFGMDPIFGMALVTLSCGGLGWLLGPFAGNAVFGWFYRGLRQEIAAKEKGLYRRIVKNRADPTGQSAANPVPDYYGEKISSLAGYRQWLKDQRAFRKKRAVPIIS